MSQKSQVKIWEAPCVIPTNKVYPPEKSPLFIEKRAYQGNTGKFSPPPCGADRPLNLRRDRVQPAPAQKTLVGYKIYQKELMPPSQPSR